MTIQEMQDKKRKMGITYAEIARRAGLPLPTVQKVLSGATRSPRYETILALEKVLATAPDAQEVSDRDVFSLPAGGFGNCDTSQAYSQSSMETSYDSYSIETSGHFPYRNTLAGEPQPAYGEKTALGDMYRSKEAKGRTVGSSAGSIAGSGARNTYPLLPWKQQGEYTAEDRETLPGDVRTELIDGVIYDMASPKAVHQIVLVNLSNQLFNQISECGRDCMVFVAPSDVWLTGDNKNIFQPDIYVICDYTMIGKDGFIKGAPPFVIEILSPSTRSKDLLLKAYKYHAAGVQEYWIVDPENRQVTVYNYSKDLDGTVNVSHSFAETVPIGISGGSCAVDFSIIQTALEKVGM